MPKRISKTAAVRTPRSSVTGLYRGIRLAPLVNPPRTPAEVLDRAVAVAYGKDARALVERK